MNALMWSCPIEIRDVGTQDPMQLLFTEDQYVIQALSPNTPQKALPVLIPYLIVFMVVTTVYLPTGCATSLLCEVELA